MGQALGGFNGGRCFCLCVQGFDRRHALGLAAFGPTRFLGIWVNIRFCGCCCWRFRSYSESPFPDAEKVTQKALPRRTALRLGSVFPRYGAHPGASPTVCFAAPPLDACGFAARRCTPTPRMDTFARPAEGAEDQKPKPKPKPKPDQKITAFGSSYRGLSVFS